MKEKYPNKAVLYFDYYKIMVIFAIEIISIEITLLSIYYKITENNIPINKDSSMRGG